MMDKLCWRLLTSFTLIAVTRGAVYTCFEQVPQKTPFDFVIIGGGTAGNALANRLTENPKFNVLVIEAGPSNANVLDSMVPFFADIVAPATPWDWNYTTVPQAALHNRSIVYPRGHILGGSSAVNYMVYNRASVEEWNRYASISGDNSWSWQAVQPYFRKNEKWTPPADHHNTTGQYIPALHTTTGINAVSLPGFLWPDADGRVIQTTKDLASEFPFNEDMNSGAPLGIGWAPNTIDGTTGRRSSSAYSYLGSSFISRKNLNVLVNARVTRVLKTGVTPNGQPIMLGVQFVDALNTSKNYTVKATKEVILSAGAVNSPQLLQLSGIGDSKLLSPLGIPVLLNNPSVGRNLSDHPLLPNIWAANVTLANNTFQITQRDAKTSAQQLSQWTKSGTGPLVDGFANQLGWLRVPNNGTNLWSTFQDPTPGSNTPHFEFMLCNGAIPAFGLPLTSGYFSLFTAVVSPSSRGSVTLASSNPFAAPLIDPGFFTQEVDLEIMKYAVQSAQRFLGGPAWNKYILAPLPGTGNTTMAGTDAQLEEYIRMNTGTVYHPTGTASMSPVGAKWGVVDPDLKVKGVSGLRVVDLSVLPIVPAAHPQIAVYVVGEKAGDFIKKDFS